MELTVGGEMQRYKHLHLLDFDPTRKRMSVILQDEDGEWRGDTVPVQILAGKDQFELICPFQHFSQVFI